MPRNLRGFGAAVAASALALDLSAEGGAKPALRFAWPPHGDATVELRDERSVGDESRTIVMTMHLHVEPDVDSGRVVVRLSDAHLVSIDGQTPGDVDAAHTLLAVGRVMKSITPTIVVSREGRFLETRDANRLLVAVLRSAGFPAMPPATEAMEHVLSDLAAEDWTTWVGAWIGRIPEPGAWEESERDLDLNGSRVSVHLKHRVLDRSGSETHTRLEAEAVYPSDAVRDYTSGFLIDLAREAKELGDEDPVASLRFLESARYGPMAQTLTVELETVTMRPIFAERLRTFSASNGRHKVDGRERRTHRFTWEPPSPDPTP